MRRNWYKSPFATSGCEKLSPFKNGIYRKRCIPFAFLSALLPKTPLPSISTPQVRSYFQLLTYIVSLVYLCPCTAVGAIKTHCNMDEKIKGSKVLFVKDPEDENLKAVAVTDEKDSKHSFFCLFSSHCPLIGLSLQKISVRVQPVRYRFCHSSLSDIE